MGDNKEVSIPDIVSRDLIEIFAEIGRMYSNKKLLVPHVWLLVSVPT